MDKPREQNPLKSISGQQSQAPKQAQQPNPGQPQKAMQQPLQQPSQQQPNKSAPGKESKGAGE